MTTNKKVQIIRGSKSYAEDILRVAAYCRVSTDSEDQVNSFIAQMHYYYSFIKQAAINARLDFEKEAWDTLKIARKALPDLESRSLEALCGYYQIPREHAHRAMDDVLETLALFRKLEEGFSEDHPEWFAAAPLKAKMKREVPATEAQKKYLADLIRYHELDLEPEWGALTKSRASRMIDQIILAHGRMEKRQRTEKK